MAGCLKLLVEAGFSSAMFGYIVVVFVAKHNGKMVGIWKG
jgi:hypothetical protein